jgi:hypothetical protein
MFSAIIEVPLSVIGMSFKDLEIANALTPSTLMIREYKNRLISGGTNAHKNPLKIALDCL